MEKISELHEKIKKVMDEMKIIDPEGSCEWKIWDKKTGEKFEGKKIGKKPIKIKITKKTPKENLDQFMN